MDRIIANQQKVTCAKVCIKIEVGLDVPRSIKVELRDGSMVSVYVEVPWMPAKCSQCGIYGHNDKGYPEKQIGPSNPTKI